MIDGFLIWLHEQHVLIVTSEHCAIKTINTVVVDETKIIKLWASHIIGRNVQTEVRCYQVNCKHLSLI